ncbi:MAG: carboxylating nicotinate-nucleotide diphosphorylase [Gammaproteobacteria bacterium]
MSKRTPINSDLHNQILDNVRTALIEDIGSGDLTASLVPATQRATATLISRERAVICGTPWFDAVFAELDTDVSIDWKVSEGDGISPNTVVCELAGPARTLLSGERTAMNFLQTLSGTATIAQQYAEAVSGTQCVILDTRKTLPGLRQAQKYAVRTGGAENHRTGLYDGILIKENHIVACGGIQNAVSAALESSNGVLVEVEVENLDEARSAIAAGAQRLLLDNFSLEDMRAAVGLRDELNGKVGLEASGNINLKNVHDVALTGVDFISVGLLTKDVRAIDLSMRFEME